MTTNKQSNIVIFGYILLSVAFLVFFSNYLDSSSSTSPIFIWILLMIIGGGIVI